MHSFNPFLLLCMALVACGGAGTPTEEATAEPAYTEDALVRFSTSSWEPTWQGAPRAGGHLRVDYDLGRLAQCRNEGRVVSWVVEVSYRFDGGPITRIALPGSPGASAVLDHSGIPIPADAHAIELWFENRAVGGYDHCTEWDSRYGDNYTRDIVR